MTLYALTGWSIDLYFFVWTFYVVQCIGPLLLQLQVLILKSQFPLSNLLLFDEFLTLMSLFFDNYVFGELAFDELT